MTASPRKQSSGKYVVVAELRMGSLVKFEAALAALGKSVRLNQTVWLLDASDRTLATVRNELLTHLAANDMMFIVDVGTAQRVWHNIGLGLEPQVRTLWQSPGATP
jgi:hypothetical protein